MPTFLRVGETENIIEKTKNSDRGTTGLQTTGLLITTGLLTIGYHTTGLF